MISPRGFKGDDYVDHDEQFNCEPQFVIGDRVLVDKNRTGSVAFYGELDFSSGDWVGIVLDEPSGNHDGKIHGREYFHCAPQHGLFVRPQRLRKIANMMQQLSTSRSPTPNITSQLHNSDQNLHYSPSRSTTPVISGRSTTESYYYDDDYRIHPSKPTIESLERKLRSINNANNVNNYNNIIGKQRAQSVCSTPTRPFYDQNQDKQQQATVFNFRPQRIQVDDYATERRKDYESNNGELSHKTPSYSMGKLLDFSTNKLLHLHDRILVKSVEKQCELKGTLRFIGQTQFATGEWAGVELDEPEGRNDGCVLGVRYFKCPLNYGLFVPVSRVSKLNPKADFATTLKSTIKSPPPPERSQSQNSMDSNGNFTNRNYGRYTPSSSISTTSSPIETTSNRELNHFDTIQQQQQRQYQAKYDNNYSHISNNDHNINNTSSINSIGPNRSSSSAYSSSNLSSLSPTPIFNKFRESDLDNALKRYTTSRRPKFNSLYNNDNFYDNHYEDSRQPTTGYNCQDNQHTSLSGHKIQPRSIKYTFKSSKYDGNPIAMKTVEYDDAI